MPLRQLDETSRMPRRSRPPRPARPATLGNTAGLVEPGLDPVERRMRAALDLPRGDANAQVALRCLAAAGREGDRVRKGLGVSAKLVGAVPRAYLARASRSALQGERPPLPHKVARVA